MKADLAAHRPPFAVQPVREAARDPDVDNQSPWPGLPQGFELAGSRVSYLTRAVREEPTSAAMHPFEDVYSITPATG